MKYTNAVMAMDDDQLIGALACVDTEVLTDWEAENRDGFIEAWCRFGELTWQQRRVCRQMVTRGERALARRDKVAARRAKIAKLRNPGCE